MLPSIGLDPLQLALEIRVVDHPSQEPRQNRKVVGRERQLQRQRLVVGPELQAQAALRDAQAGAAGADAVGFQKAVADAEIA